VSQNIDVPSTAAICRFTIDGAEPRLGWFDGSQVRDLSASRAPWAASIGALLATEAPITEVVSGVRDSLPEYSLSDVTLLAPIDHQEVWAAGVTYERSREAREQESEHAADMYARVYAATRPELFFKADARRTAGPDGEIRVRPDSSWSVPEPELALVLSPALRIAAYTIGNDVSARDIEGENPLYLPQAKVYDGACALGPWLIPSELVPDPHSLEISCRISRDGQVIWRDSTTTAKLHRTFEELVSYLGRSNSFPGGAFLLTGTCLVPPDSLTLQAGDDVTIEIAGLGTLRNTVGPIA
jgi:2-dehydro-3-deoxy-D-arabinonate dehydratase